MQGLEILDRDEAVLDNLEELGS